MDNSGHQMSRRRLLKTTGAAALGGLAASMSSEKNVFAHEEHGAEADFVIEVGDLFFKPVRESGEELEGVENAPVHIHSGTPHLMRFENVGAVAHEIHFGRNADLARRLYSENLFGGGGDHVAHNFLGLHLNPGEGATLHIWIPEGREGEWEMGCFIPGHYEGGQRSVLVVEAEAEEEHHDE